MGQKVQGNYWVPLYANAILEGWKKLWIWSQLIAVQTQLWNTMISGNSLNCPELSAHLSDEDKKKVFFTVMIWFDTWESGWEILKFWVCKTLFKWYSEVVIEIQSHMDLSFPPGFAINSLQRCSFFLIIVLQYFISCSLSFYVSPLPCAAELLYISSQRLQLLNQLAASPTSHCAH